MQTLVEEFLFPILFSGGWAPSPLGRGTRGRGEACA
jgi:hypothetical protein